MQCGMTSVRQPESDSLKRLQQAEELQWQVGVSNREGYGGKSGGLVHCYGIKCMGGEDNLRRGVDWCVCVCVCVCMCACVQRVSHTPLVLINCIHTHYERVPNLTWN